MLINASCYAPHLLRCLFSAEGGLDIRVSDPVPFSAEKVYEAADALPQPKIELYWRDMKDAVQFSNGK